MNILVSRPWTEEASPTSSRCGNPRTSYQLDATLAKGCFKREGRTTVFVSLQPRGRWSAMSSMKTLGSLFCPRRGTPPGPGSFVKSNAVLLWPGLRAGWSFASFLPLFHPLTKYGRTNTCLLFGHSRAPGTHVVHKTPAIINIDGTSGEQDSSLLSWNNERLGFFSSSYWTFPVKSTGGRFPWNE